MKIIVLFVALVSLVRFVQGSENTTMASPLEMPRARDLFRDEADDGFVRVFVGYNSSAGMARAQRSPTLRSAVEFPGINAIAVEISKKELLDLEQDFDVVYVEKDELMYPMAQIVPYGIKLTKANNPNIPSPGFAGAGDCSNARSFKVAIVDTGIYAGHPDLFCSSQNDRGCKGRSFGTSSSWFRDAVGHGEFGQPVCRTSWPRLFLSHSIASFHLRNARCGNDRRTRQERKGCCWNGPRQESVLHHC